jgi:hypothetical protein
MLSAKDIREFRGFLRNATDRQVQGIYEKEKRAGRDDYAELAVAEAEARGIYLDLIDEDDEDDDHSTMLKFPRWRVDVSVGGDVVRTTYETATTKEAAIGKAKRQMRGAVSSAGAFKFRATRVDGDHARKKQPPPTEGAYWSDPAARRRVDALWAEGKKKSPGQLDREIAEALAGKRGTRDHATVGGTRSFMHVIAPGDRVTIVDRFGQERTGRAVMRGPHGWVLNMGGAHGTPAIATDENITRVKTPGRKTGHAAKTAHATKRALPPLKRISTTAGDFDSYLAVHRDPMNDHEFRLSWYSLDGTGSIGERGLTQAGFRSEAAARAYAKQHYGGEPIRVPAWGTGPDMTTKIQAAHPEMTKRLR